MRIENLRFLKLRPSWRCRHRWERVGRDGRVLYEICWRCMKERSVSGGAVRGLGSHPEGSGSGSPTDAHIDGST